MQSPIQILENGDLTRVDALASIPLPAKPWHGFPIEFLSATVQRRTHAHYPHPHVLYCKGGGSSVEAVSGHSRSTAFMFRGSALLRQAGYEAECLEFRYHDIDNCAATIVEIHPGHMHRFFDGEIPGISLNGIKVHSDDTIGNLFALMEMELLNQCRTGRLYAESLSIALASYLARNYAGKKYPMKERQKFSPTTLGKITAYITDHLDANLSIGELAKLVHLSPFHFARIFKASTNRTPHRFVTEQRVLQAQRLLLRTGLGIADIAHRTGFSSQSHLSTVLRKELGITPSALRARQE